VAPSLRACSKTHTGIRVRIMQGSPPQTSGREAIPGNAPPSASTAHLRIRVLSHSGTDFSNASNSGNPATASLSQLVSTQAFLFPFAETAPPPVTDPDADLASKTVCISGAVDVWPERGPVAGDPGIVPLRRLPGCTWRFHTRRFSASMLRCACSFRRI